MNRPVYDIGEAKELVSRGCFVMSGRAARFVKNRYGANPRIIAEEVFASMSDGDFYKSMELDKIPGVWADVYMPTYDGFKWYAKFYIDEGTPVVQLLSCNWDGCLH